MPLARGVDSTLAEGLHHLGVRGLSDSPSATASTAPSTAPTPVATAQTPLSYSSIRSGTNTGGLSWQRFLAPVTGDPVYTAQRNGQTIYVGPDNQPYVGSASNYYYGQGTVNPVSAVRNTWASLFPSTPTSSDVYESTYGGPGVESQAHNDAAYAAIAAELPAEHVVMTGDASGVSIPAAAPAADSMPTPPALSLPAPPSATLGATSTSDAGASSAPLATSAAAPVVVGNTTTAAPLAAVPSSLVDALQRALAGGGGGFASPDSAVGVPSTAGIVAGDTPALDALQPAAVDASSSSNTPLLIVVVGALALGGLLLFEHFRHRTGRATPPSPVRELPVAPPHA